MPWTPRFCGQLPYLRHRESMAYPGIDSSQSVKAVSVPKVTEVFLGLPILFLRHD
jgi:hypothetical protein